VAKWKLKTTKGRSTRNGGKNGAMGHWQGAHNKVFKGVHPTQFPHPREGGGHKSRLVSKAKKRPRWAVRHLLGGPLPTVPGKLSSQEKVTSNARGMTINWIGRCSGKTGTRKGRWTGKKFTRHECWWTSFPGTGGQKKKMTQMKSGR